MAAEDARLQRAEVRVRRARPEDLPAIMGLFDLLVEHQAAWRVFAPRAGFREDMRRRFEDAASQPDAVHLVAEAGAEVVGMAFGRVHHPSSQSDEFGLEVSSVVVAPEHRRQGVSAALLAELAAFGRLVGARMLTLRTFAQNEEGMRTWVRLGFRPRVIQMAAPVETVERAARGLRH